MNSSTEECNILNPKNFHMINRKSKLTKNINKLFSLLKSLKYILILSYNVALEVSFSVYRYNTYDKDNTEGEVGGIQVSMLIYALH
jgi:hypothetical protein